MEKMRKKNKQQVKPILALLSIVTLVLPLVLSSCGKYDPNANSKVEELQDTLLYKKASKEDLDFPSHDPSIATGKAVFQKNCSQCHGSRPGKLLSKKFMRTRSPKDQYLSVTKGFKGQHSFRKSLARDARWDALLYMRAEILGYFDETGDDYAYMASIFGGNCAVCHGTRGDGDGDLHKSLEPLPANFNMFTRLYTRSDNKLFDEISHGIPWTAMPAWKDRYDYDKDLKFDDQFRWKLVRYVRQFGFAQTVDRLDEGRQKLKEYKEQIGESYGK